MTDFASGRLYFIKDAFFDVVDDKYLKINKVDTQRPHYYVYKDSSTKLLWIIPCSSQVVKYRKVIEDKEKKGKKYNHIQIIKVSGISRYFCSRICFLLRKNISKIHT